DRVMDEILIVVIDSGSVYVEKLNKRLYQEIEYGHYYHDVFELAGNMQRSLHLFRLVRNPDFLSILLRSYETLEATYIYSGKVLSIRQYYTHGDQGPEGRLKIQADNRQLYDIPATALETLDLGTKPVS
ncbi:MAG: hypothetical protein KGO92_14390, partial [Bacteroidota bacterium]|nr:hypothetical protein [Bacteroidota bacterium]